MNVVEGLDNANLTESRCILTIGNFDGVHRGHQRILAIGRQKADDRGVPLVVMTFEPHPLAILNPANPPRRIASVEGKLEQLQACGVDCVVIAKSRPELLQIEAVAFIESVIVARFHPVAIVEGFNFGFGKGRTGSGETLKEFAGKWDYEVELVEPFNQTLTGGDMGDGEVTRTSSSLIRRLITEGRVSEAADGLGRPFSLDGPVVEGSKRGRTIGFPTANLAISDQIIPADGVYAGRVAIDGTEKKCAISIGSTPTFDGHVQQVEAHVLDFDGDLYGQHLKLEFIEHVREQTKFSSIDALVNQIKTDVEFVRNLQY
ncbi:MAG: bifunctional riboflavin kinase/FAD synthetase [Phycisphaerae bacterium]|nr:bifunctional riboflavin kinase/FAD synthetase [Phycisphaerales bacterium]